MSGIHRSSRKGECIYQRESVRMDNNYLLLRKWRLFFLRPDEYQRPIPNLPLFTMQENINIQIPS